MRSLTLAVAVILLAGCEREPTPERPPASPAQVQSEVTARVEGYLQAIRDLDFEYMQGFWADVDGFTVAGDGALIVGYGPWMEQLRGVVDRTASVNYVEVTDPQVFVLGRDAASYSMAYRWSMNLKDGSVLNAEGSWTYVFKRFEEGWRVVHSAGAHTYS